MSELILWTAVVAAVRAELDTAMAELAGFAEVKAYGKVPTTRPRRFTRVLRVGGQQTDLVTMQPSIILESWGASDEDAEAIADRNHAIMLRAGRNGSLGGVPTRQMGVLSAPQRLPDLSGQDRYSAMYAPQMRGQVA